MKTALFALKDYYFEKASFDFSQQGGGLSLLFNPSGCYYKDSKTYVLNVEFKAYRKEEQNIVSVTCVAEFVFNDEILLENIPEYFYTNSIAIMFPYIRSFVSTLSLQANVIPIILPTLNLSDLGEQLKKNTTSLNNYAEIRSLSNIRG